MIKEIFDNSGEKLRMIVYKELVEKVGADCYKKGKLLYKNRVEKEERYVLL